MAFLDISSSFFIDTENIVCILDMDKTTTSKITRDYLRSCEKKGMLNNKAADIPKSIIVSDSGVYFVQPSVLSLKGRL